MRIKFRTWTENWFSILGSIYSALNRAGLKYLTEYIVKIEKRGPWVYVEFYHKNDEDSSIL